MRGTKCFDLSGPTVHSLYCAKNYIGVTAGPFKDRSTIIKGTLTNTLCKALCAYKACLSLSGIYFNLPLYLHVIGTTVLLLCPVRGSARWQYILMLKPNNISFKQPKCHSLVVCFSILEQLVCIQKRSQKSSIVILAVSWLFLLSLALVSVVLCLWR